MANTLLCAVLNSVWLAKLINLWKGFLLKYHNCRNTGHFEVSLLSSDNINISSIPIRICSTGAVFQCSGLVYSPLCILEATDWWHHSTHTLMKPAATRRTCITHSTSLREECEKTN